MGISHKKFFGWIPKTGDEVEWTEAERNKMLALRAYKDSLCPRCGGPIEECTDPRSEGNYTFGLPVRCHKTTALLLQQEKLKDYPRAEALMLFPQVKKQFLDEELIE